MDGSASNPNHGGWQGVQDGSRGQNLVLVALAMAAMMAMLALVIDGGVIFTQRRRMQNAADAAAMAAVRQLALGGSEADMYQAIQEYAVTRNGADTAEGTFVPTGHEVQNHSWHCDCEGATGIEVETSVSFPTFFAGVLGMDQFAVSAVSEASYGGVAQMTQGVYPVAANWQDFQFGQTYDIYAGGGPGNFGWLSWDGCNNVPCLCASLTPPGNSENYINPYDPNDHTLSIGDWVEGAPGVKNASCVRDRLDAFVANQTPLTVIVWDQSQGQGSNLEYHIAGFAVFILEDYRLPGQDRITGRFIRWVVPTTMIQSGTDYGAYGVKLSR